MTTLMGRERESGEPGKGGGGKGRRKEGERASALPRRLPVSSFEGKKRKKGTSKEEEESPSPKPELLPPHALVHDDVLDVPREPAPADELFFQNQCRGRNDLLLPCFLDDKDLVGAGVFLFSLSEPHLVKARLEGLLGGVGDDSQLREEGEITWLSVFVLLRWRKRVRRTAGLKEEKSYLSLRSIEAKERRKKKNPVTPFSL